MVDRGAKKSKRSVFAAAAVVVAAFVLMLVAATQSFTYITDETIDRVSDAYLEELGATINSRLQVKAQARFSELLLIAEPIESAQSRGYPFDYEHLPAYLDDQREVAGLSSLSLVSEDGRCYTSDGQVVQLTDAGTVSRYLENGDSFISLYDISKQGLNLDPSLLYYFVGIVPVDTDSAEFVGLLGGVDAATAETSIGNDAGESDNSIITPDGAFVVYPSKYGGIAQGANLFDLLERYATFYSDGGTDVVRSAIAGQQSLLVATSIRGAAQYLYFTPLENTDLYICVAMPFSAIDGAMVDLSSTLLLATIVIILLIVAAACLFTYFYYRALRNSSRLLAEEKERAEQASDEARHASMAKSDFLSRMSHEIRTPLSGVIGMTDIALNHVGDDGRTVDSLRKIQISSEHLLSLINDILDMSKIESGKVEIENAPFDLGMLLASIGAVSAEQARSRSLLFETSIDERARRWYIGDQLRLSQILYNLLSNAMKFTPEGGRVTLSVGVDKNAPEGVPAEEGGEGAGGRRAWVSFVVADTGCGISPENLGKVFEAFEQENADVAREHGGTGLGLAITKRFSEMMGGSVSVESKAGEGTRFTVAIPLEEASRTQVDEGEAAASGGLEPHQTAALDAGTDPQEYDFTGKRILLAEDNDINREIGIELIGETGAQVEAATNGEEAFDMFSSAKPGYYDMILMDIQMPYMNGYEATKAIRAMKREDAHSIPIVAMTANAFADDVKQCIEAGMDDHISKPLDTRTVFAKLAKLLA